MRCICLRTVSYTHLEQLALTVQQMQEAEGVTEALKAADQLGWVRRMNSIRNRAEEIIKTAVSYTHLLLSVRGVLSLIGEKQGVKRNCF